MTGIDLVVVGEALMDVVSTGDQRNARPGGSPLNVATGLSRLGVSTQLVTAIGSDPYGQLIQRHLSASGVHLAEGSLRSTPTSTASAVVGPNGAATYTFDVTWDIKDVAIPEDVQIVHTGSIGSLMMPGAQEVLDALRDRPSGVIASFDPNIRPDLLVDSRARVADQVGALYATSDVVKMSDEDAAWLHPGESADEVASRVLDAGPAVFALTTGSGGCLLWTNNCRVELDAVAVDVVDTIGAGDAFMSGLLYGFLDPDVLPHLRSQSLTCAMLEEAGRVATRCAAIAVSRPGADPPWKPELFASTTWT